MYCIWEADTSSSKTYTEARVVYGRVGVDPRERNAELRKQHPEWKGLFPATKVCPDAVAQIESAARPADYFTAGSSHVVSDRLKQVLEQFPDLKVQFAPLPLRYRNELYPEPYWELCIQDEADPVDYERSVIDSSGFLPKIESLVLEPSRAEGKRLFRAADLCKIMVHQEVAQAVLDAGCMGAAFVRCEAYHTHWDFAKDRKERLLAPVKKGKSTPARAPKPPLSIRRGRLETYPAPPAVLALVEGARAGLEQRCRFFSPGRLRVTGGRLSASDPWQAGSAVPCSYTVGDGEYPLFLAEASPEARIALAGMLFSSRPVAGWVRDEAQQVLGQPGFGVDSGLAALFHWGAHTALLDSLAEESFEEKLEAELEKRRTGNWTWCGLSVQRSGLDAVLFSSGRGDGVYPVYWGRDEDDQPVCLLIDFGILTLHVPA